MAERSWQPALGASTHPQKAAESSAMSSNCLLLLSAWATALHQEPPWGAAIAKVH